MTASADAREWLEESTALAPLYLLRALLMENQSLLDKLAAADARVRAAYQDAMDKVRDDCTACDGSGAADRGVPAQDTTECEYCGRPRAAIRALMEVLRGPGGARP